MAVNIGGNNNSNNPSQATAGMGQQSGGNSQPPARKINLSGGSMFSPLGNGQYNQIYQKLKEKLVAVYKEADPAIKLSVYGIDRIEKPNLAYSILVITGKAPGDPAVAYHVLLLEGTGTKPSSITINVDGQQIEVARVSSDAVDDILIKEVRELINRETGVPHPLPTDVTVVPADFDVEDDNRVFRVARNTGQAIATTLEMAKPDFKDLNLNQAEIDPNLVINVAFNNTNEVRDEVGNVIRADVMIAFSAQGDTNKFKSLNSGVSDDKITEVDGFIDLMWNPVNPIVFNQYMQQQQSLMSSVKYSARFIITNLLSDKIYTTGGVLLALYTALALNTNSNWVQYFRPVKISGKKGVNMKDIGALGIEANFDNQPSGYGSVIDTQSPTFTVAELGKLVAALIRPDLAISIDIPESGPQTWYESVFSAAADNNSQAIADIISSANELTSGEFGRLWKSNQIFAPTADGRIHLGFYHDPEGNKRDIRDIDYLAVCNYAAANNNPRIIADWSDTFTRLEYKEELRMFHRARMISAMTNESAVFTGRATRRTFDSNFMEALAHGIMSSKISTRINTPMSADAFNSQRAAASFLSQSGINPNDQFFNIRSVMGSNYNPYSNGYTRW